jgi:excisionase family DNA binding protein
MHEAKPFHAPLLTLTIPEALRAIGIGRSTLYKLIDSGQVRRVKVGKRTLVRYDDLQKLVAPEDCAMHLDPNKQSNETQPLDAGEAA